MGIMHVLGAPPSNPGKAPTESATSNDSLSAQSYRQTNPCTEIAVAAQLDATPRLKVGLIRAQASLPHRIWCRNPQYQTVTGPKGRHFQWLSLGKSLGSKPEW